jgi:hypothetical protein
MFRVKAARLGREGCGVCCFCLSVGKETEKEMSIHTGCFIIMVRRRRVVVASLCFNAIVSPSFRFS